MASGELIPPGEKLGPCAQPCEHIDCKQTRDMAAVKCRICGQPIGYSHSFYQEGAWDKLVHAECLEREIEEEKLLAPVSLYAFPDAPVLLQKFMAAGHRAYPHFWMILYVYAPLSLTLANQTLTRTMLTVDVQEAIEKAARQIKGGVNWVRQDTQLGFDLLKTAERAARKVTPR